MRPILWRLMRWHYGKHPEDSRMYFSIGATAILRGEFELAEEKLSFALKLLPNDLQAQARITLARALQGRIAAAKDNMRTLKRAPRLPGRPSDPGYPYPMPDSDVARYFDMMMPFLDEPRLDCEEHAKAFQNLSEELFGEAVERWMREHREAESPSG